MADYQFNPLIFVPSIRTIPQVWKALDKIKYDKFITKNHRQSTAYQLGHNFFLHHKEYTHLVVCPDDLIINLDSFNILKKDIIDHGYNNLAGVCPVDERNVDDSNVIYACISKGAEWHDWYRKKKSLNKHKILPKSIFEAGFTGSACQFINRELAEKLSFTGAIDNKTGMDRKMAIEMTELNVPIMIDPTAMFKHLNMQQRNETIRFVENDDGMNGYVKYINSLYI